MVKKTKKPQMYCAALPLSALPELQEFLAPFLGGEGNRENVIMMRLGDESAQRLDDLVEGGLFGSRSEAAAFLVGAGIQAQKELFTKIARHSEEIKRVRQALRGAALEALKGISDNTRQDTSKGKTRKAKSRKKESA